MDKVSLDLDTRVAGPGITGPRVAYQVGLDQVWLDQAELDQVWFDQVELDQV